MRLGLFTCRALFFLTHRCPHIRDDDVRVLDGVGELGDLESVLLRLVPGFPVLPDTDGDVDPGVVEAEGLGPSLGAVSEDGDLLSVEDLQVHIVVVVKLHHGLHLN